jgi:hypothetical protein
LGVQGTSEAYHEQSSGRGNQLRRRGPRRQGFIQAALGVESDDVVNYCFPKTLPTDRERRARCSDAGYI